VGYGVKQSELLHFGTLQSDKTTPGLNVLNKQPACSGSTGWHNGCLPNQR